MSMLKTSGDTARVVRIEVEKLQRHRAKHEKMLSGREVMAIIFESFRSSDNADVMSMIDNLLTLVTMCGYPKPNTQCIGISVHSFMCAMKTMCKHSLVEPGTKVDAHRNTMAQAHAV